MCCNYNGRVSSKNTNASSEPIPYNSVTEITLMHLIVFDIDGTLAATDYEADMCYAEAFQEVVGRSLEGLDFMGCEHVTDSAVTDHFFQQLFGRNALETEIADLKTAFRTKLEERQATHPELFLEVPGAQDLFHTLKSTSNVYLGIATGAWRHPAAFKLDTIGLDTTGVVFYGADDHYSKEYSINKVIADSKALHRKDEFTNIVYIGDRIYDKAISEKLGIGFVGVDHEHTGILTKANTQHVFNDLKDLESFAKAVGIY